MNATRMRLAPGATTMIRMDHTHVMATFHRYRLDAPPQKKRAVADLICAALEIHARLEEEIFYPAMRRFDPDLVEKSVPEHNEMRRLIARLGELAPDDAAFDATLLELMRNVIRHVADEETLLLPDAERVLGDRLQELGVRMTKRRFELAGPRAGEIAVNTVRTYPAMTLAATGVIALAAFAAGWALTRPSRSAPLAMAASIRKVIRPSPVRSATRAITSRLSALAG
jgi:hypothetical protein